MSVKDNLGKLFVKI